MSVRFTSTRNPDIDTDFVGAMVAGQPPDGGLYIPFVIPEIPLEVSPRGESEGLETKRSLSVTSTARTLLGGWVGEKLIETLDLDAVFPFPIVVETLRGGPFDGIRVVEVFHGPTGSFKDFGARFLAASLTTILPPSSRSRVVIVATSGDTGSAVADAFSGKAGFGVVILYPAGRVSKVQEAQLTQPRDGVWTFAVKGSFDDCQRAAKAVLATGAAETDLITANSINVGRLFPQMLFYAGVSAHEADIRHYVVPCGNLGNLTAGLMARSSSIPSVTFTAATNANDHFVRVLRDASVGPTALRTTYSNAMDVAVPSNLERIQALFTRSELAEFLTADSVTDGETLETMRAVYDDTSYVADPHTAVGLRAALGSVRSGRPLDRASIAVIATADPEKYRSLVEMATGVSLAENRFGEDVHPPTKSIEPGEVADAVAWVSRQIQKTNP
jgi:threonine synthase